jgi:hypothetical protein
MLRAFEMAPRYQKNPLTAGRIIEGQAFVVTADNNRLHTLNSTATHLWKLADSGFTAEEAADDLCRHFAVDRDTALADLEEVLPDLVERQILVAK